jgi:DNA-binding NarL/FixJ family response regulator
VTAGQNCAPNSARILVVDDYAAWRARVREILAVQPEWRVIAEAANGVDAVRKANDLQPDIVILDIGLPLLNGIEAAKVIREKSPRSRVVFLTQTTDSEIIKAALSVGQALFVAKAEATQLCNSITALMREV